MPLKLLSSGGGSVLLTANTTASDFTVNVPAVNGNMVTTADTGSITQAMLGAGVYAGYGPAFSAYHAATQSISFSTWTKVQFNTKEFDTANCFDNITNHRFTPNVAGYYQCNGQYYVGATTITRMIIMFYKNGSAFKSGNDIYPASGPAGRAVCTALIYMNGTTDYLEVYGYATGTGSPAFGAGGPVNDNFFQASFVRAP